MIDQNSIHLYIYSVITTIVLSPLSSWHQHCAEGRRTIVEEGKKQLLRICMKKHVYSILAKVYKRKKERK